MFKLMANAKAILWLEHKNLRLLCADSAANRYVYARPPASIMHEPKAYIQREECVSVQAISVTRK